MCQLSVFFLLYECEPEHVETMPCWLLLSSLTQYIWFYLFPFSLFLGLIVSLGFGVFVPSILSVAPFSRTLLSLSQFPRRLYEMLMAEEVSSMTGTSRGVISWSDSGNSFHIRNINEFVNTILPKYFRTRKFSSFQRNHNLVRRKKNNQKHLHLAIIKVLTYWFSLKHLSPLFLSTFLKYGFAKLRRGPEVNMYSHPSFQRGAPDQLVQLRKTTSTNTTTTNTTTTTTTNTRLSSSPTSFAAATPMASSMTSTTSSFLGATTQSQQQQQQAAAAAAVAAAAAAILMDSIRQTAAASCVQVESDKAIRTTALSPTVNTKTFPVIKKQKTSATMPTTTGAAATTATTRAISPVPQESFVGSTRTSSDAGSPTPPSIAPVAAGAVFEYNINNQSTTMANLVGATKTNERSSIPLPSLILGGSGSSNLATTVRRLLPRFISSDGPTDAAAVLAPVRATVKTTANRIPNTSTTIPIVPLEEGTSPRSVVTQLKQQSRVLEQATATLPRPTPTAPVAPNAKHEDRGKLDLLTLAIEHESFLATAV